MDATKTFCGPVGTIKNLFYSLTLFFLSVLLYSVSAVTCKRIIIINHYFYMCREGGEGNLSTVLFTQHKSQALVTEEGISSNKLMRQMI